MAAALQETVRLPAADGVAVTPPGTPAAGCWAVPVASEEAALSGAFVRVAITRTVYSVPPVSPVMVWLVPLAVACREAASYVWLPDFHCTL